MMAVCIYPARPLSFPAASKGARFSAEDMTRDEQKQAAAEAALELVEAGTIVGIGTGSTANYFIDALAGLEGK